LRDPLQSDGPTVAEFWGAPQDPEENGIYQVPRGCFLRCVTAGFPSFTSRTISSSTISRDPCFGLGAGSGT
jgi:hypothetical protein